MTEEYKENTSSLAYRGYNAAGVIEKRLNTDETLSHIEYYLSGSREIVKGTKIVTVNDGTKRANQQGVQSIMSRIRGLFNSQVVQGNLDRDQYEQFIQEVHEELAIYIMTNLNTWEIKESEYCGIVDSIMNITILFISRTIDNKERESYGETMRAQETNVVQQKGGLGLFNGKGTG